LMTEAVAGETREQIRQKAARNPVNAPRKRKTPSKRAKEATPGPPRPHLREMRMDRGLTQKQLGKLVNLSQQRIAKYENGAAMDVTVAVDLARALQVEVKDILGLRERPRVPIIGKLSVNGLIVQRTQMEETLYEDAPPMAPPETIAFTVAGDMWPLYRQGDVVFCTGKTPPSQNLHDECVVELEDGSLWLKRVLAGSDPEHFHLHSVLGANVLENQRVLSCRRVEYVKKAKRSPN
jgi:DNA-binding XRE family transcriptional regulator